jgi:3-methyladenine DNA glycosylase AlkD
MLRENAPGTIWFGVSMRFTEAENENSVANRLTEDLLRKTLHEMRRVAETGESRAKIEGMQRFGIRPERAIGLNTPQVRTIARSIGRNQVLAEALWETGIHDARILAALVGDPDTITRTTMDKWVRDIASWDVCDACCCNLFDRSPHAWSQIRKWAASRAEFVRRAAFATIAALAVHDKAADDRVFIDALPLIEKYAFDDRNFVKKAVNWALRNIGKRNETLRPEAIACAERVRAQGTSTARWIAADALRELNRKKPKSRPVRS